jgi:type II secretory pathway pseudopilin PulG
MQNVFVKKNIQGFTLVETLVSFVIISFSLMAIVPLLTSTLKGTVTTKDYYTAARLAQEGIELVKAKRNTNLAAGTPWKTGILDGAGPSAWEPDATQIGQLGTLGSFHAAGPTPQVFCVATSPEKSKGRYTTQCISGASEPLPGDFTRVVTVEDINSYAVLVTSLVRWSGGNQMQVSTVMYSVL